MMDAGRTLAVCTKHTRTSRLPPKVALSTCKGGAITYVIDDLTEISDGWILKHVFPCMLTHAINHHVCKVWVGLFHFEFWQQRWACHSILYMSVLWSLQWFGCKECSWRRRKFHQEVATCSHRPWWGGMIEEDGVALVVGDACQAAAVCNQEVCLLCSQIVHLCGEVANACTEAEIQLMIINWLIWAITSIIFLMGPQLSWKNQHPPRGGGTSPCPCPCPTSSTALCLLKEFLQLYKRSARTSGRFRGGQKTKRRKL